MKNAAENFSPELLSYPETDGRSSRAATPEQMAASAKILDRIVALTSVPVPRSNETASAVEPVLTRVEVAVAGGQATAPQGTAASAADKRQPRILLIPLEFMAWKQAKSWSYTGNFAIEEGLEANGADCFVLPAWFEFPADSPDSLLKYARELCHGREFDQVWVWLTHNRYGDEFFCWLASLAPVRVGLTMESMEHSAEELSVFPHFRGRREFVAAQLRYMTHVLVADEIDAENFAATLPVKALWYPPMIPRRCVCDRIVRPTADFATFSGALYGSERAALLACKPLEGLLSMPVLPEQRTTVPQIFDNLHRNVLGELRKQRGCDPGLLAGYVEILRKVRRQLFDLWLEGFRLGFASVNLPSIFKGYAGRVAESMAAGMAVVSWDTPNRPRNRALFTADKEILLFDRRNPDELARHLRRLKADPSFAMEMATNARQKILLEHTAEIRTRKILDWLDAGTQPSSATASPRQAPMPTLMSALPTEAKPTAAQPANRTRVLLIVPEHTAWERAKTLGYAWSFGLEEGLMAGGCEVFLVPAFSGFACSDRRGWLGRVQDLLRLQKFDQVWVNALQVTMEPGLLSLLATLVPVRVAFFDESIDHGVEEMTRDRSLAERKNRVLAQVRDYTHCVCADEKDCRILAQMGFDHSQWLPGLVPASLGRTEPVLPTRTTACFAVVPNGSLAAWAAQPEHLALLEPLLVTDDAVNVAPRFDQLNREVLSRLPNNAHGGEFPAAALTLHVKFLRTLRIEGLDVLAAKTRQHLAHVVDTVRPGRIMECILVAMAGGVPVIIPRSSAAQLSSVVGEGVYLCYDEADPGSLKLLLENLAAQPEQRRQLVATALVEVRGRFSSATRVAACLEWVRNTPAARHNLSGVEHHEAVAPKPGPTREEEDAYYRDLFVNHPFWSSKNPNPDESARWEKISECLKLATQTMGATALDGLRILDVGCGRGWLTNLVSAHGHAEGVEPVPSVIDHARKLYPKLRFHVGTVGNVLEQHDFKPFDLVVSSEVIEHVPDAAKPVFIGQIRQVLKPGGVVIITTPRKEIQPQLQERGQQSQQPIEQWLSEAQVRQHFMDSGFRVIANRRVLCDLRDYSYPAAAAATVSHPQVVDLYQVWCFQAPLQDEAPVQPRPVPALKPTRASPASTITSSILGVIFSNDRPLQLGGALRSFFARCQDADRCQMRVLYRASSEYQPLYDTLIREYPKVRFVAEQNFRSDLLKLLSASELVLMMMDDNLFIRNFTSTEMVEALREHPLAVGFSMRLGRNTTFCYPLNKTQALPSFETETPQILSYDWTRADCDFNYPLEVSSSVYRTAELLPLLREMPFKNPNTLEGEFAARAPHFQASHPRLLCFDLSRAFCNPINLVQTVCQNGVGGNSHHSPERLAQQFQAGARLDVDAYLNFTPTGCHQEVPLYFRNTPAPSEPVISVIIPCYNHGKYLPEAVQSVLHQTFTGWELIIINDGSPDNTSVVARQLIQKHPSRIRLIEKANGGLSSARNAGIRAARGEYIFLLDADDRILPTMLEKTKAVLDTQPKVGFAYTHIQHFGALNDVFPLPDFDRATLISKDNIVCGNCLVRKAAWQQAGGYNELMREGYEDWDFWIGCVEQGWEGFCIREPLFCYRKIATSMLSDANQKRERLIATIVCNHPGLYNAQTRAWADDVLHKAAAQAELASRNVQSLASLRVTYLISSILGVTGGNQTLLRQADELQRRGHDVTIVTYTPKPNWFTFKMRVVQVPSGQAMAPHVPPSDVVISTYFINTHELLAVKAAVKVYYAQGDQFIFADTTLADSEENQRWRQLSRDSYLLPQVRFVPNSHNLARAVENMTGRKPDGLLPVCTDQTIFRPLQRSLPGSKVRILIVGPDVRGSSAEPLSFKGIQDIHDALHLVVKRHPNFTVVRMSGSPPEIFQRFPCEFYVAPSDEMKTVLFGTADILIYASHYDSCPRPPQEAMAAGCAVVCTATPGAMEYCRDGENCLLVPIQSPQAIADATLRLMTDRALRDQLVQGGFATARKYPRELEWNELETMMHQFVEEASNAPTPARASLPLHPAQPAVVAMPPVGKMGSLN